MSATLDDPRDIAAIKPIRFWTEYRDQPNGQMVPEDWAEWVKKGDMSAATTAEKIVRVKRDAPVWEAIRKPYEAWKEGTEAPLDGTPLDAVPFVTKELAAALARVHIRTVEDLAKAEDAALSKLAIPGIRGTQAKAKAFLDVQQNQSGIVAELAALRAKIESISAERDEALRTADTLAAESGKRRRTREEV